jgi:hypothetical protein
LQLIDASTTYPLQKDYLKNIDASYNYLTIVDASNTYALQNALHNAAANIYLSRINVAISNATSTSFNSYVGQYIKLQGVIVQGVIFTNFYDYDLGGGSIIYLGIYNTGNIVGLRTALIGNNSSCGNGGTVIGSSSSQSTKTTMNGSSGVGIGYNVKSNNINTQNIVIMGANSSDNAGGAGYGCIIIGANTSISPSIYVNPWTGYSIGYGTSATIANQIIIGTSGETIYCPGNPITGQTPNTCLVLSSNITLNTLLNTPPTSGQLGCQVQATITSDSSFNNNLLSPQNFATFTSLPLGVWYITGSINLTQTSGSSDSVLLKYSLSTTSLTQNSTQYGFLSSFCTFNNSFGFNYNNVIINNISSQTYYLVLLKTVQGQGLWYKPNITASYLIATRIA